MKTVVHNFFYNILNFGASLHVGIYILEQEKTSWIYAMPAVLPAENNVGDHYVILPPIMKSHSLAHVDSVLDIRCFGISEASRIARMAKTTNRGGGYAVVGMVD